MYGSALNKYAEYLQGGFDSDIETDVEKILLNEAANDTEKATLLKTRIGQGSFRQKLISNPKALALPNQCQSISSQRTSCIWSFIAILYFAALNAIASIKLNIEQVEFTQSPSLLQFPHQHRGGVVLRQQRRGLGKVG